jgi:hypothetical protein
MMDSLRFILRTLWSTRRRNGHRGSGGVSTNLPVPDWDSGTNQNPVERARALRKLEERAQLQR